MIAVTPEEAEKLGIKKIEVTSSVEQSLLQSQQSQQQKQHTNQVVQTLDNGPHMSSQDNVTFIQDHYAIPVASVSAVSNSIASSLQVTNNPVMQIQAELSAALQSSPSQPVSQRQMMNYYEEGLKDGYLYGEHLLELNNSYFAKRKSNSQNILVI